MSSALATFLFELVNVLLLASLLGWLLFRPVRAALQERVDSDRRQRDELRTRLADVQSREGALEQQRRLLEGEATALRKGSLAAAEQEAAAIIGAARESAQRERDRANLQLAHLEEQYAQRLSVAVAAATRASVAQLLTTIHGPDIDASLVRAACRQLEALRPSGPVCIESVVQLQDGSRAALIEALGAAATAIFRLVPELGAGLRITTAHGAIDVSARGFAREAEIRIREALAAESV